MRHPPSDIKRSSKQKQAEHSDGMSTNPYLAKYNGYEPKLFEKVETKTV